jgi:hypothetical protein
MSETREDVIRTARELDAAGLDSEASYDGPGRFEGNSDRALAVALDIITGHGLADEECGEAGPDGRCARVGAFLLWTDSQGFRTADAYASERNASEVFNAHARDAEEAAGPDEEDATISDGRGAVSVAYGGKHLGDFPDENTAENELAAAMARDKFWPNVWRISDHGNAHLISERFYSEHKIEQ